MEEMAATVLVVEAWEEKHSVVYHKVLVKEEILVIQETVVEEQEMVRKTRFHQMITSLLQ